MPRLKERITIGGLDRYFEGFLTRYDKKYEIKNGLGKICERSAIYISDIINNDINRIFSYIRYLQVIKPNTEGYYLLIRLLKAGNYAAIDETLSFLLKKFEEETYGDMPYFINVSREDINDAIINVLPEKADYIISEAERMENDEKRKNKIDEKYASDVMYLRDNVIRNGFYIDTSESFKEVMYNKLNKIDPETYLPITLENIRLEVFSDELDYYDKSDLEKKLNKMWDLGDLRYFLLITEALANYHLKKLWDEKQLELVVFFKPGGNMYYCYRLKNDEKLGAPSLMTSDDKEYKPYYDTYDNIDKGYRKDYSIVSFKSRKRSRRKSCKYGRKKSGGCKKKPGRKRSKKRSRKKSRKKSCKYGRKKSGGCKKKPGRKKSRR